MKIGRTSISNYFNGLIDEARVSNSAVYTSNFTPQQHLTANGSTKGLWKFDSQSPNDASTKGNHGSLQGGATYSNDVPGGGGGGGTGVGPQIQWLVSDHLSTPRMVFAQTGNLANVKRHDYLPFGEELFAGVGGRTVALGYSGSDGVRQQFTSKERDIETGLDYFLARYYSSTQGRFTSPDEFKGGPHEVSILGSGDEEKQALVYADITNPQSLNKYQYTFNNPLRYVDPDGRAPQDSFHNRMDHLIRQQLKGEISEEEYWRSIKAAGYGGLVGLVVGGSGAVAYRSPQLVHAVITWATRNPDKAQAIMVELVYISTGSPAPGAPGTLTISTATRLSAAEISTGARLAKQADVALAEGKHVGEEFISAAGKTYDAMGSVKAYQHWGNGAEFLQSILDHVRKSVDYVSIDLKGASKSQIKAIKQYVSGLTEEQQKKIIYVE